MNGLYIHIPFCKKKCNYCDFASYPDRLNDMGLYVDALCREMELYKGVSADTVYFGGGTPSLLKPEYIDKISAAIHSNFKIDKNSEITIEVNPGTIDADKARFLYNEGFNRVSLGAQCFSDTELKILGRCHSVSDTLMAYDVIGNAGFNNISFDLMYAIPGQNMDTLSTTLSQMLKLSPEHISCYGLKIEEGTPFCKMLESGEISEHSEDSYADMYDMIRYRLKNEGYVQYELSNFSKPGFESRHNLKYWQFESYIGLGLGASSFYKNNRYTKTLDFQKYIDSFENCEYIKYNKDELMGEYMMLSLRLTGIGADKAEFQRIFSKEISDVFSKALEKHIKNGMIIDMGDRYVLSERAYYISNMVLCDFI